MNAAQCPMSLTRAVGDVRVTIGWSGPGWDDLPAHTRNQLRDLMDETADVLAAYRAMTSAEASTPTPPTR